MGVTDVACVMRTSTLGQPGVETLQQALQVMRDERTALAATLAQVDEAIALMTKLVGDPVGKSVAQPTPVRSTERSDTIPWTAAVYDLLRETGAPMRTPEMIDALARRGYRIKSRKKARDNITGVISRKARRGEMFSALGSGTFGLLEWGDRVPRTNGHRPQTPRPPAEGSQTAGLLRVISAYPGLTAAQVAARYAGEASETEEQSKKKKDSRVTRVGQLVADGRVRKGKDGGHYIAP